MMGVAGKSRRRRRLFNSQRSRIGDFQTCADFVGSWRICPSNEAQAHAGTGGRTNIRPRLDGVKWSIDVLSRHRDTSITCPTRHSRLTLGWAVVTLLHRVCRIPRKSRSSDHIGWNGCSEGAVRVPEFDTSRLTPLERAAVLARMLVDGPDKLVANYAMLHDVVARLMLRGLTRLEIYNAIMGDLWDNRALMMRGPEVRNDTIVISRAMLIQFILTIGGPVVRHQHMVLLNAMVRQAVALVGAPTQT
jgi:hypothetical protein